MTPFRSFLPAATLCLIGCIAPSDGSSASFCQIASNAKAYEGRRVSVEMNVTDLGPHGMIGSSADCPEHKISIFAVADDEKVTLGMLQNLSRAPSIYEPLQMFNAEATVVMREYPVMGIKKVSVRVMLAVDSVNGFSPERNSNNLPLLN